MDWAIYLASLKGDKLGFPSKTNFHVNKPDEEEQRNKLPTLTPKAVDAAAKLETDVMTVWVRRKNQMQLGRGDKISKLLRLTITSSDRHYSDISKDCDISAGSYSAFFKEGIRATQNMLYPPDTLDAE